MKVYNENKTEILTTYDLNKGYLKNDTIRKYISEKQQQKEVGHYEIVKEYSNGGKDVKWIVEIPHQEYSPASEQIESIMCYIPYTENQLKVNEYYVQIDNLKQKLKDSDYKAIKFAEGELSEAEYSLTKIERRKYRFEINQLESLINQYS